MVGIAKLAGKAVCTWGAVPTDIVCICTISGRLRKVDPVAIVLTAITSAHIAGVVLESPFLARGTAFWMSIVFMCVAFREEKADNKLFFSMMAALYIANMGIIV